MRRSPISTFRFDLTEEQRQLCAWVAEQARQGAGRVLYTDARSIGSDADITRVLREVRERVDNIHRMVHSPIVNTTRPYFDLPRDADHIWDDYCRAEMEQAGSDFDYGVPCDIDALCHAECESVTCGV